MPRRITGRSVFFIQVRFQILKLESFFPVTGFSDRPSTCDAVERISSSLAASDVAATASSWILAAPATSLS
jgi:hypothetical protein